MIIDQFKGLPPKISGHGINKGDCGKTTAKETDDLAKFGCGHMSRTPLVARRKKLTPRPTTKPVKTKPAPQPKN